MSDQPQPQIVPPGQEPIIRDETEGVIAHPAKLLRLASMIRELVEEVRGVRIDDPGRDRLAEIYRAALEQLKDALSPDLQQELETLMAPLEHPASESEVRVAQAQLLGWLEGLFHGIQAALWAQHMQAQAALQEVRRRQLGAGQVPGQPGQAPQEPQGPPGQYL